MPTMKRPPHTEVADGVTTVFHADDETPAARGRFVDGEMDGYWEWYRLDGTMKRSGHFARGEAVGEWVTYAAGGIPYKVTQRG
jgi:antitoxin component YwqK of YwqJK toxin-antitoxin module